MSPSCVYAGVCLLLVSVMIEGRPFENLSRTEYQDLMEYQDGNEIDTGPYDFKLLDEGADRAADTLLSRLLNNELRDYPSFNVYRSPWADLEPLLPPAKRMPVLADEGAKSVAKSQAGAESRIRPKQTRWWKAKKGRGIPNLCYFKLCSFRRPS